MSGIDLERIGRASRDRVELWAAVLNECRVTSVAEVGVWRGEFAAEMLRRCPSIETYYLIDPWRHLEDWNKPANVSDEQFDAVMAEARARTEFAADRVRVLRGRTAEVVDQIAERSLDFAYLDGDHSLRGITLDLQLLLPKLRERAWIGGDDFTPDVWQHPRSFEPSFVFPYAVYFAEAIGAPITALGFRQFLIELGSGTPFAFVDPSGRYPAPTVAKALTAVPHRLRRVARRARRLVGR